MELNKIEILIEKYFEGNSNLEEEKELKKYFALEEVAPELAKYRVVFGYFSKTHSQELKQEIHLPSRIQERKRAKIGLSIAASIVIVLVAATSTYFDKKVPHQDLGTYNNPELAIKEIQKELAMLSQHVNIGIESVSIVEQYEDSKKLIFKQ